MMNKTFHPDEWTARQELASCYRVFASLGWTEMIYNHITVRLSDAVAIKTTRDSFQFNPSMGAGRDVFDALVRRLPTR